MPRRPIKWPISRQHDRAAPKSRPEIVVERLSAGLQLIRSARWPFGDRVKNLRIFATLVNGEQLELQDCPTGRDLVRALLHQGTPAKALVIEASDKDGHIVRIIVPADESETAKVSVTQES